MNLTIEQVGDLLATAAAFDSRTVGKADLMAWAKAIGDLDYDDASQAIIDHYTESTDWLKPAHVRNRVKNIRRARLANADRMLPAADPDAKDYSAKFKVHLKELADGRQVGVALTAGSRRLSGPTAEYMAARGADYVRRRSALAVICPAVGCERQPGKPCREIGRRREIPEGYHQVRLQLAMRTIAGHNTVEGIEDQGANCSPVSTTPWCGACHDETRTLTRLTADGQGLERHPCPTCGPETSRGEASHDR